MPHLSINLLLCALFLLIFNTDWCKAQGFVHPGLLHTKLDLDRMKNQQNIEPWKTALVNFKNKHTSNINYVMRGPFPVVTRQPEYKRIEFDTDMQAAWDQALLWYITGDTTYQNKSKSIMTSWARTLESLGGTDAALLSGDNGIKICNAAEIIRSFDTTWAQSSDFVAVQQMLLNIFYPLVAVVGDAGWGGSAMKTTISIAVVCDNHTLFDKTIDDYKNSACARVNRYLNEDGQPAEAGRDQGHPAGAIDCLTNVAQTAWNQGIDLFSYADNRLLKGSEYYTKYNLGGLVPFTAGWGTCHATYWNITPRDPKNWLSVDAIYSHYVLIKGLAAPYTQQYRDVITPLGELTLYYRQVEPKKLSSQTINFPSIPTKSIADADFDPGATSTSNLSVVYTVSNPAVATFTRDNKIHLVGGGSTLVYAHQLGNTFYSAASTVVRTLNIIASPYRRIEAEDYYSMSGIQEEITKDVDGILNLAFVDAGDWTSYYALDFGSMTLENSVIMLHVRYALPSSTTVIQIRLNSAKGTLVGTCQLSSTGSYQLWKTASCATLGITGVQNLYLVYEGRVNINWFQFTLLPTIEIG